MYLMIDLSHHQMQLSQNLSQHPNLPSGNLGAAAAGATSKDTSKVTQGATSAEPAKKLSEDEEVDENTLSLAERVKALKEARKHKAEKEEKDEKEGLS